MTPKARFAVAATAALILALPANAAQLIIGFSQMGSEAAETVNLKIADAQQNQENQIKTIRSLTAQGVARPADADR